MWTSLLQTVKGKNVFYGSIVKYKLDDNNAKTVIKDKQLLGLKLGF